MISQLSDNYKGIILAILGFGSFSIADGFAKWFAQSYSVVQVVGTVSFFSLFFLILFSPKLGGLVKTMRTRSLNLHIARGLNHSLIALFVVLSFSKLTMSLAYTLFFIAPFVTTLLAIPVFKEHVSSHGWIAISAGFLGVFIVLRPGISAFDPWALAAILAACLISAQFLLARAVKKEETSLSMALFPILSNFTFVGIPSLFISGLPPLHDLLIFAVYGLFIAIGLSCTLNAFRFAKSSVVSPFHYTQMIWAILIGYFVFGEIPDLWTFIGGAVIIGSGIYLIERERSFPQ